MALTPARSPPYVDKRRPHWTLPDPAAGAGPRAPLQGRSFLACLSSVLIKRRAIKGACNVDPGGHSGIVIVEFISKLERSREGPESAARVACCEQYDALKVQRPPTERNVAELVGEQNSKRGRLHRAKDVFSAVMNLLDDFEEALDAGPWRYRCGDCT